MISRPTLVVGSVLKARCARNLWSEQPLAPPAEDVITGLEFLVDLPMRSLVGQQDEKSNKAAFEMSHNSFGLKLRLFSRPRITQRLTIHTASVKTVATHPDVTKMDQILKF